MDKTSFVIVGQYSHAHKDQHPQLAALTADLSAKGEVNIFDMPRADGADSIERDGNVLVHHYLSPKGEEPTVRLQEMVRDVVLMGAKEYYLDYGVEEAYQPVVRGVYAAMRTYGINPICLNRKGLCGWFRRLFNK